MNPKPALDAIADAILDGTPVDWRSVDAEDLPDKAFVEQLKTLAALRQIRRASVSMPPEPWRWGHLQVFERIGHGAFGDVHRAWDPRLEREVALKLLRSDVLDDDGPGSAVIEEGRLLARVRHPNVVTIYGAEPIDGRIGLWMEFVKGRTLEEALRSGRTFTAAHVTRLGVDLCAAVAAVHAAGLVHRDIKAQNVMLDDGGRLVLMDFGTGYETDDSTGKATAGTPLYLAPEVLSGGAATRRSDVYSIGVVLFRLLTGSYPVFGGDLADLRRAHASGDEGNARLDRAGIPVRLRRVLGRAIDPDPDRRYAGADMFGAALAALDRAPTIKRVAYGAAAAAALLAALGIGWSPGLRAMFMRAPAAAAHAANTPTIAVLPFVNASSDPGNDDFIDGLTSEVIRNLAVIDGLQVRSQTSSFFFKNQPRDLHEVAKQLQVALVVEAYVHIIGNQLRINAQLVRVPDDVPVWSNRFDRTLDDVFAIQDEISRAIVNELRLTLGRGQRRYQTNLAAYDLYLRGRALVARRGTQSAEQAARLFEQVIAIDREFAPAHAGLADAYATMSWAIDAPETALAGMRPAAVKALQLDPELAEAHAAMGVTYARERDWENATSSFERAIRLNPNLSEIRTSYSVSTLVPQGHAAKALDILAGAREMDPLSLAVKWAVGWAQFIGGRYEEAIVILREVVAADPDFPYAANILARALTFAGRPEEAIALWESRPQPSNWERWLMPAYVKLGRRADVDRLLNLPRNANPYRQALNYAALGDKERTFEALSRAAAVEPLRTAAVLAYPEMSLLRGDPRLDQLRKRFSLR
ncbi:MAG TPA: protein kinase [Vicinamibacterales bacterium]|nr:protein kinase [Vicinamibacterales bacterium]